MNFEILRKGWPAPAGRGGFIEAYMHADPCFERTGPDPEPTQ
jgi:hypothetical protein